MIEPTITCDVNFAVKIFWWGMATALGLTVLGAIFTLGILTIFSKKG